MLDSTPDRPVVTLQSVFCAYCGGVMEVGRQARRFCRPSCRARFSADRRDRRLLALAEELVTLAKRRRRAPRRTT